MNKKPPITKEIMRKLRNLGRCGYFDLDDLDMAKLMQEQLIEMGFIYKPKRIGIRQFGQGEWLVSRRARMIAGDTMATRL